MSIHPLPLILASESDSRRTLLKRAGLLFDTLPSHIDETTITGATPEERAVHLAQAKITTIMSRLKRSALFLSADTVILFNAKVMEKPKTKIAAVSMLKELSDNIHSVLTGWAIYNSYKDTWFTGTSVTYVTFRKLTHQEIIDYVNDNPVTSWAAAYNAQLSSAIDFINRIEGSYTGINGLPLEQVIPILRHEWLNPYKSKQ